VSMTTGLHTTTRPTCGRVVGSKDAEEGQRCCFICSGCRDGAVLMDATTHTVLTQNQSLQETACAQSLLQVIFSM
jgi:hypothetical protein